jgi:membrane protease YdiL (CAAX protease family)
MSARGGAIEAPVVGPAARAGTGRPRSGRRFLAAIEVGAATAAIVANLVVPTIVILLLMAASLLLRRERLATVGLTRLAGGWHVVLRILGWVALWTLIQLGLVMPALNHLTGRTQDLSEMADVEGSVGLLLVFLLLTWTIAAFGEELVYRGYLPTRVTDALGSGTVAVVTAVVASSVLFGLAHTEQGLVGVVVTFLDALFFSALRLRYRTVWASILAHGFNNTIGLVALFLVGPIYGLW